VTGDDMLAQLHLAESPDAQRFEQLVVPHLQRIVRHSSFLPSFD
jgi:hypothetical protein